MLAEIASVNDGKVALRGVEWAVGRRVGQNVRQASINVRLPLRLAQAVELIAGQAWRLPRLQRRARLSVHQLGEPGHHTAQLNVALTIALGGRDDERVCGAAKDSGGGGGQRLGPGEGDCRRFRRQDLQQRLREVRGHIRELRHVSCDHCKGRLHDDPSARRALAVDAYPLDAIVAAERRVAELTATSAQNEDK